MRFLRQFKSILQLHLKAKQRICSELSWFPKMQSPKSVRNAQTQHGEGSSVDVENIFLHRFMLSLEPVLEVNNIGGQDASASPAPECVWFHSVTDVETAEKEDPSPTVSLTKELTEESSATEKRKAESTEDEGKAKKAKFDDDKDRKTKRPGFSDERYDETSYYFENGLRKVYPYFFTFTTFAKGRWVDEKILDVFVREFRAAPPEEYERSLEAGKLTVNNEKVPKDYKIKHNDLLANVVHRFIPAVAIDTTLWFLYWPRSTI
nr:RNA pseudouridylate synthase domain-containing protein 2 isoform X5 [Drosophila kikkawai]